MEVPRSPSTLTFDTPKRPRSRTISDLNGDGWRTTRPASGVFSGEEWHADASEEGSGGEGSAGSSSSSVGYGALDETDSSMDSSFSGLRRKLSFKRTQRKRSPRSRSVGDSWTRTVSSQGPTLFDIDYQGVSDDSFDEFNSSLSSSLSSSPAPSTPSSSSSRRSTPEPSECDFDLRLSSSGGLLGSPRRRVNHKASDSSIGSPFLSRRHTLPRRKRNRGASISISLVSSPARPLKTRPVLIEAQDEVTSTLLPTTPATPSLPAVPLSLPAVILSAAILSAALSLPLHLLSLPLLPTSPLHLLHPSHQPFLEYTNAFVSSLVVTPLTTAAALTVANLVSSKGFEEEVRPPIGVTGRTTTVAAIWAAIFGVRVTLAWAVGIASGWPYATAAIHEVGAGLAPLLLSLHLIQVYQRRELGSSLISFSLLPTTTTTTSLPAVSLSLPAVTLSTAILSAALSLSSPFLALPLLPASPVHLLHPGVHPLLEYTNAFFSSLLVTPSTTAVALALANLVSLKGLEEEVRPYLGVTGRAAAVATIWTAILGVRVTLAWVFGRVLGWAHPQFFATAAIHEVGAGLAPLLLALHLVQIYRRRESTSESSLISFPLVLLAANFSTPIVQGGSGLWWGASGAFVGALVCALMFVFENVATTLQHSTNGRSQTLSKTPSSFGAKLSPMVTLLLLPLLSSYNVPAASHPTLDTSFATLHPSSPTLLTVLLMTAPRPGNPDFLLRTIDSWLSALPEPVAAPSRKSLFSRRSAAYVDTPDISSRIRLVVYTHFGVHDVFDEAKAHFSTHPMYAAKAAKYVEWHRDPRGKANRLDQRLHVARGLEYASRGGTSAYVMLTEDDFPLCPDAETGAGSRSWNHSWEELKRALVATNEAMPDRALPSTATTTSSPVSSSIMTLAEQEATSGHCGLFAATGGSGLAIRGFVAAQLPALLLGADDPHGNKRAAKADRGEFSVKHEDEGADTPDLVIQDCLRGRIAGCDVCAPPSPSDPHQFPEGSARNPRGVFGDRWGKSGLAGTERLLQHHLGYNASTLPGRRYGKEEWACGWRQPFNGEPDVLTV